MTPMGRPYSVLTSERVSALWAEYQERPYNVSARARALGIKPATLAYHLRGGKVARVTCGTTWRSALKGAHRAAAKGNFKEAAQWMREAADRIEKSAK